MQILIQIVINDQKVTIAENNNLIEVLSQHGATAPFAVAVNGEFVAQSNYEKTVIKSGDLIDVVSPIFGG